MKVSNFVIAGTGLIIFGVLILPIGLVHEGSHKIVCELQGGSFDGPYLGNDGLIGRCEGEIEDDVLVRFSGGFAGMLVSLIPVIYWKEMMERKIFRGVLAASLAFSIWQAQKMILEPFAWSFYDSEIGAVTMLIVALIAYAILIMQFVKLKKPKS